MLSANMGLTGGTMAHGGMEHPENTLAVAPLVDEQALSRFCRAVQQCADGQGLHDQARVALAGLRAKLSGLTNIATLVRFAIVGQPHAFARVVDSLRCLEVDFSGEPLAPEPHGDDCCGEPGLALVQLTAAVD